MMNGLLKSDNEFILKALRHFDEIDRAVIFGSRAMGNFKKGSDVDIAVQGEKVTRKTVADLDFLLNEEYPLPYFFDVVHYENIKNDKLVEHIDRVGVEMYRKGVS
ncbi:nucleotidyltransferase family protein [Virgibacillus dakarensis]|uniref:nucleotidyltransferase family protein n=1 Tax=Virgibacillus dakarensis TaxID=1917889 RepID=UPI001E419896|nr:nucleotidyltransferase domain-containing protein [Virgibacillus dakarensis]